MVIKEGIGKLFKVIEKVTSHLTLHSYADNVAVILNEIAQKHSYYVENQNDDTRNYYLFIESVGDKIVEHSVCYDWIHHSNARDKKRSQHIQRKHKLMRLIVCNKSFQHSIYHPHHLLIYIILHFLFLSTRNKSPQNRAYIVFLQNNTASTGLKQVGGGNL